MEITFYVPTKIFLGKGCIIKNAKLFAGIGKKALIVTYPVSRNNGSLSDVELYDPVANTWSPAASLTAKHRSHTATLLQSGMVLVTGGYDLVSLTSVEVYDPGLNSWTDIAPLNAVRRVHSATLLPNGKVLVSAGFDGDPLSSAEVFDPGLGFADAWRPVISSISMPEEIGDEMSLTDSGFRGFQLLEASGGGPFSSATNYPLVQVRNLANEGWTWMSPGVFSSTSFTSLPVTDLPQLPAIVTVFVNGIPSLSKMLVSDDVNYLFLPIVLK